MLPKFLTDKNLTPNVAINPALNYLGTETAFGFGAEVMAVDASKKFPAVYKFHVGDTGPKTPEPIIDVAIQALKDKQTKYGHYAGFPQVLENIARYWSQTRGVAVKKENVILQPGGKPAMEMAYQALLAPGDKVITQDPGYPVYDSLAEFYNHGGVLRWKAHKDEATQRLEFRVEDLAELLAENSQVKIVCLNTPQNPTGMMLAREKQEAIAELVRKYRFFVLYDDIYDLITFGGRKHFSFLSIPGMLDWTININGCSKDYAMTGWRLGFVIAPKWLTEIFGRLAINKWSNVSRVNQIVAGAIFGDVKIGDFFYKSVADQIAPLIKADVAEYERKGNFLVESLRLLAPFVVPNEVEGAFYDFPSVSKVLDLPFVKNELKIADDKQFRDWLLYERGFACLAGSDFGEGGRGHIRLSYSEDRAKHIIPGIKYFMEIIIELITRSGQTPPLRGDEVGAKVGEIERKYF